MRTTLPITVLAAAISFVTLHADAATDGEAEAIRLFDMSESVQESGPCSDFPFLRLTNENMVEFRAALASGAYDDANEMVPRYVACFDHQRAVVHIRTVIHAEFPGTEGAFRAAERGYFTEQDIDEFVALLEEVTGVASGEIAAEPRTRLSRKATSDPVSLTGIRNGRNAQHVTLIETETAKGSELEPSRDAVDETVAALLRSLEKEIREGDNLDPNASRNRGGEAVANLLQDLGKAAPGRDTFASAPQDASAASNQRRTRSITYPSGRPAEDDLSALAERATRVRQDREGSSEDRPRSSFATTGNLRSKAARPAAPSQISHIRRSILECWVPPSGLGSGHDISVAVRFDLLQDGSLQGKPLVANKSELDSPEFRQAADAIRSAVRECTPLAGLPEGRYEEWREVELTFDLRDLPAAGSAEVGILGAGDEVKITIFGEEDLSGVFKINATGWISVPLIGRVAAAGHSSIQLEASIARALLSGHMRDPHVSVEILTFEPIFVLGEVNRPGSYPFAPGLTMLKAIALAGGYTSRARTNALYLIRRDSAEAEQKIRSNKPVMPGDTIFVKERWF